MALQHDTRAPSRRTLAGLVAALALLALPAAAGAARVYVMDSSNSAGKIFQYTAGSGGALSPTTIDTVPSISLNVPIELSLTPSGQFAYTAHTVSAKEIDELGADSAGTLSALSGSPLAVTNHLSNVAVAPNGVDVYFSEETSSGGVRHGRIQANGTLGTLDFAEADPHTEDVVVTPDGRFVYAANDGGTVSRYTVNANGTLTANGSTTVGSGLESLAVSPDAQKLFVGRAGDGKIYSFQINSNGALSAPSAASIGGGTADIAVAPLGGFLYSTGGTAADLAYQFQINADSSLTALTPASVGTGGEDPEGVEVSPDGGSLYVVNQGTGNVAQYDIAAGGTLSAKSPATVDPTSDAQSRLWGAAVQPVQGPAAALTVTPAGGSTFNFDASGSTGNSLATYSFDFGDGSGSSGSSATVSHTYTSPGTYTARVTVADGAGFTSAGVYTGHSTLVSGGQASQQVTVPGSGGSSEATSGTLLSGGPGTTPPGLLILEAGRLVPVFGQTLLATPVVGDVLVKLPGTSSFVPIESVTSIPVGTVIDATDGKVRITAATDTQGHTQQSIFYGGLFQALQPGAGGAQKAAAAKPSIVEVKLVGSLGTCTSKTKKSATAARRRRSRHVWGSGRGSFRTRGRYASATVRGTVWLTKDTCSTTTTVVRQGTVTVRDFVRHKTVRVKKGHRYVARKSKK